MNFGYTYFMIDSEKVRETKRRSELETISISAPFDQTWLNINSQIKISRRHVTNRVSDSRIHSYKNSQG